MPYSRTPTYKHSRRRAVASLARRGNVEEARRVSRAPRVVFDAWMAGDPEFLRLLERAAARAERQFDRQVGALSKMASQL